MIGRGAPRGATVTRITVRAGWSHADGDRGLGGAAVIGKGPGVATVTGIGGRRCSGVHVVDVWNCFPKDAAVEGASPGGISGGGGRWLGR